MKFLKGWTIETDKLPNYGEFKKPLVEMIDAKLADLIIQYKEEEWTKTHKKTGESIKPTITELCNLRKRVKKNMNEVKYHQANGLGRFYGDTFTKLPKKIKHTLFSHVNMVDLDQHRGHPTIALGLGDLNGTKFSAIDYYVNNTDDVLAEMAEHYGIDITDEKNGSKNKDRLKWFFNLTIYGGGYKLWVEGLTDPCEKDIANGYEPLELKTTTMLATMKSFKKDCDLLKEKIWENNPHIKAILMRDEKYREKEYWEKENSVVSYFMQIIENDALFHAYKYLKKENILKDNIVSLEMDGLCFPPTRSLTDYDVDELNKYVRNRMGGFPITYKIKKYLPENIYDDMIEKREDIVDVDEDEGEMEKEQSAEEIQTEKDEIMYQEKKMEWEDKCCRIENEDLYFVMRGKDEPPMSKSSTQLKSTYSHLHYGFYLKKVKKEWVIDYSRPKSFIKRWLDDPDQKQYKGYGIYAPPLKVPDGFVNLWFNFPHDNYDMFKYDKDGVDFILNHIKVLCNNDEDCAEYIIKWLAHMIQYPAEKTGRFPIFISNEGCGKGTLNKIIKALIGEHKYFETTSPENYVWGKFNSLMANALFVLINEFGKKNANDAEGRIKGIMTDEEMNIKGEGDKPYKIVSYHRFMGNTNNQNPFNTKKGTRREWIIRCSDELIENFPYFKKINALIKDDNVIKSFYRYLLSIDVENFIAQKPPQTEYQTILQEETEDMIHLFIKDFATEFYRHGYDNDSDSESDDGTTNESYENQTYWFKTDGYTSGEIYDLFKAFRNKLHIHNYECSALSLMKKISLWATSNKLITKRKGKKCNFTEFNFDGLVEHFKLKEEYAEEEEDELPKGECLINMGNL